MNIHESAEDYLETILVLSKRMPRVRSVDIANEMNFSRPSVSVAMKHFRENGLITVDSDGNISLTDAGLEIAQSTYDRHMLLTELLVSIGGLKAHHKGKADDLSFAQSEKDGKQQPRYSF